jgi:hypothetical protein
MIISSSFDSAILGMPSEGPCRAFYYWHKYNGADADGILRIMLASVDYV